MQDGAFTFSLLGYSARLAHADALWLLLLPVVLSLVGVYALWRTYPRKAGSESG